MNYDTTVNVCQLTTFTKGFQPRGINHQMCNFPPRLSPGEVASTARSIAKYTHKRFTEVSFAAYVAETHTPEIQAERGRKGGKTTGAQKVAVQRVSESKPKR